MRDNVIYDRAVMLDREAHHFRAIARQWVIWHDWTNASSPLAGKQQAREDRASQEFIAMSKRQSVGIADHFAELTDPRRREPVYPSLTWWSSSSARCSAARMISARSPLFGRTIGGHPDASPPD
jgi:hypothetical protein